MSIRKPTKTDIEGLVRLIDKFIKDGAMNGIMLASASRDDKTFSSKARKSMLGAAQSIGMTLLTLLEARDGAVEDAKRLAGESEEPEVPDKLPEDVK